MRKLLPNILLAGLLIAGAATPAIAQKEKEKSEEEFLIQKDPETGAYQYSEVFTFDSTKMTQADAYKAAKRYILSTLKTADNNTLTDDPANAEIISNGALGLKPQSGFGYAVSSASVDFKLKLYFKPGRYKITMDNVVYNAIYQSGNTTMPVQQGYSELRKNKAAKKFKANIDDAVVSFVSGLRRSVENKDAGKNDW